MGIIQNYRVIWKVLAVILGVINCLLAGLKETFLYQIKNSKDNFAVKNNFSNQIALMHKIILALLFFLVQNKTQAKSMIISNLIFSIISFYEILSKIPFYSMIMLKTSVIFSSLHFGLSIGITISLLGDSREYLEVIQIIIIPFLIHISLKYINSTLERIMLLDFKTPEEAAHMPILLKISLNPSSNLIQSKESVLETLSHQYGLAGLFTNEISSLLEMTPNLSPLQRINTIALRRCDHLFKTYPTSTLLSIVIAQINLKKFGNVSKGLSILNKIKRNNNSIPVKRTIEHILTKLEYHYSQSYLQDEEKLEALHYFETRDNINFLKNAIQEAVFLHKNFWQDLANEFTDMKSIFLTANEIIISSRKISSVWKNLFQNSDKMFGSIFLMYTSYLYILEENAHEKADLIDRYRKSKEQIKKVEDLFAEDSAVFLVSVEKEKLGRVIDSSASVKNLFKIDRKQLVGQKLDDLMPKVVARNHDKLIENLN